MSPIHSQRKVLRRKKPAEISLAAEHACHTDPVMQAALVAEAWGASVQAVIRTGVLVAEALRAFAADPDRLDAFIIALVEKGVLTSHEARRRRAAPKLVKLRTIGEHEKLLKLPQIARFLAPSYTTMYQLIVLFGELAGDDEGRQKRLLEILEAAPDEVTREFLSDETERLKRGRKAPVVARRAGAGEDTSAEDGLMLQEQPQLVLITPDTKDERAITTPYATADGLEQHLPFFGQLRETDALALVLVTRVSALPLVADKLLALCGFDCRHARFFLAQPPTSAEIGDASVIVVTDRGGVHLDPPAADTWLDAAGTGDPRTIAARLYPEAASRLHVFARSPAEGWESLVGAENRSEE